MYRTPGWWAGSGPPGRHDNAVQPRANAVAPRHQTRPGGGAAGLDEKLGEHQTFSRERIEAGRRCAQHCPTAIGADIAKTEVVGKHQHHIGPLGALRGER